VRAKEDIMIERGTLARRRHLTDFKGLILELVEHSVDEYEENEITLWKVLWFEHPFGKHPEVETIDERHLESW
jgi:hypothetical protein